MLRTSRIEIRDLLLSWVFVTAAFAIAIGFSYFALIASAVVVATGFLLHELAHKLVAQHFGCAAEYRANYAMLTLSVIISIKGFLFIAPGGVLIGGFNAARRRGEIALAGPITNIALAIVFLALLLATAGAVHEISLYGTRINSWLALFNLIPLAGFDGAKVLAWNKRYYAAAIIFSAFAVFAGFMVA